MSKWDIEMVDTEKNETVSADLMETCKDGAIEFVDEGRKGPTVVRRVECKDWRQVVKQ